MTATPALAPPVLPGAGQDCASAGRAVMVRRPSRRAGLDRRVRHGSMGGKSGITAPHGGTPGSSGI
ncbi:hypothetical protein [Komagataeibacter medellinensis]|uniref:hypothetical protein n=1 Tax=Komagataeibacter medellinensis TaxID=1177712 RepID=UPI0011D1E40A|nr:hypothetical protein [Komagataeibacter medellinensis]